ncbi:unnamed protein product [Pylaiella littoralis]
MRHHVQASDALEPLGHCQACTLRPPCRHISEQELASRGIQRRKELPQRRGPGAPPLPGGRGGGGGGGGDDQEQDCMDCQGFVRRGACRVFNERGRCSNHHPLDVHIVEIPRPRCPQCTIHLPCGHCDYDRSRRGLQAFCEVAGARVQKRIARLRRLLKTGGGGGGGGSGKGARLVNVLTTVEAGGAPTAIITATATTTVGAILPASGGQQRGTSATIGAEQLPKPTFGTRVNGTSSRSVNGVVAKLDVLGSDLEEARAWTADNRKPGGGMHEFRALVFDKKQEMLFRRCEEAHEEAEAISEAYLTFIGSVR